MRLPVVHRLQPVLERAQVAIAARELRDGRVRQLAIAREQRQRAQQRARLQLGTAAAAHELKRLHDELDLADPAGTELDVLGHVLARDFLRDQRLHLPQRVEHAVVEVAAVDERREDQIEYVDRELVPRDQPRFDVRVALPIAPVLHEIRLERRHADDERPARAERPQARVDAVDEAVAGVLIEQLDQQLGEPQVVGLRLRRLRGDVVVRLERAVRIEEHEVDVGGEIQLAAAELAHAEHEQRQRLAERVARPPETRLEQVRREARRAVDQVVREQRELPRASCRDRPSPRDRATRCARARRCGRAAARSSRRLRVLDARSRRAASVLRVSGARSLSRATSSSGKRCSTPSTKSLTIATRPAVAATSAGGSIGISAKRSATRSNLDCSAAERSGGRTSFTRNVSKALACDCKRKSRAPIEWFPRKKEAPHGAGLPFERERRER